MIGASSRRHDAVGAPDCSAFLPLLMLDVELSDGVPSIDPDACGRHHVRGRVLVLLHGTPIGGFDVDLSGGPVPAADLAQRIWERLRPRITAHLMADGMGPVDGLTEESLGRPPHGAVPPCRALPEGDPERVTIVIATHGRPHRIGMCVQSVIDADYPAGAFEVVVVDNAPASTETRELIEAQFGHLDNVTYLVEPVQSRARARNRGLNHATTKRVAFLDDDVVVDRLWLRSLVRTFNEVDNVGSVTSMILPAELETAAQLWIEEFGGFDKGYDRKIFDLDRHVPPDPLYPYTPGKFGSGASMAFDRELLISLGGFDPALLRGQDVDALLRVVLAGWALVYEPSSFVRHYHHRDYADLQRVVQGYGVGLAAIMTKTMLQPSHSLGLLMRAPRGFVYLLDPNSGKNQKKSPTFPKELTSLELRGVVAGPFTYLFRWRRSA